MGYDISYKMKYTDNPYVDLLVHETKNMAINSIVKNEREALRYETLESRTESDKMISARQGVPIDPNYNVDNYVESNRYYRILSGQPPFPTDEEIKAYKEEYGNNADISKLYYSKYINLRDYEMYLTDGTTMDSLVGRDKFYLHQLDQTKLDTLERLGIMNIIRDEHPGNDYSYIYHMADKAIDPFIARTAENFSLLYCPKGEFDEIHYKYKRMFDRNRLYTISTIYSEAFAYGSVHYDAFIQILIVIQTMVDMISEVQEYIINKDVFDSRTIRYLFESYGIPYYKEIPVKYQLALIKNVNKLLKYKSTNRNIVDICELFGFKDIEVFTYYILKTKRVPKSELKFYTEDDITITKPNGTCYLQSDLFDTDSGGKLDKPMYPIMFEQIPGSPQIDGWIEVQYVEKAIKSNPNWGGPPYVGLPIPLNGLVPIYNEQNPSKIITEDMVGLEDFEANYDLKFLKVPITEPNASKYIEDEGNKYSYDYVTNQDPFWDGISKDDILTPQEKSNYHNKKKLEILSQDFSCERTKYISVDANIDVYDMSYQLCYFMSIINNAELANCDLLMLDIDAKIFERDGEARVHISDLLTLATALSYLYNGVEPDVITNDRESNMYIHGFNFDSHWTEIFNNEKEIINVQKLLNEVKAINPHKTIGYKELADSITEDTTEDPTPKIKENVEYGYLVESDAKVDEGYTVGAYLSGRYKACTCETTPQNPYESYIWENLSKQKIYDYSQGYDSYTENGINGHSYPTYLEKDIISGAYPESNFGEDAGGIYHIIDNTDNTPYEAEDNSHADFINIDYIANASSDLEAFENMKKLYLTNMNLHDHLAYMMRTADNKRIYDIYKTLYDSFMITKVSTQIYSSDIGINKTYYEYLSERNSDLYGVLDKASKITNSDEQKTYISNVCEYIAYALEKYFESENWSYIYNIIPNQNVEFIQSCILKMVIFFKSWKTQMLDQTVSFALNNPTDNRVYVLDDLRVSSHRQLHEKVRPIEFLHFQNNIACKDYCSPTDAVHISLRKEMYIATEKDFIYYIVNNETYLVRYIGTHTVFRVAEFFEGSPVVYIEEPCFGWTDVEHVVLPDGVTWIK